MLLSHFQSVISTFLKLSLNNTAFQEVSDLLSEEDLLVDLGNIFEIFVFEYFGPGFNSGTMEHLVITIEYFHHCF